MIQILKPSEEKLEILEKPVPNCWINVVSPTDEELAQIKTLIDVPDELLRSLKYIDKIPEIEKNEKFTFLIIRTPYNNLKVDLEYFTVPVGIFVTNDLVMTVCFFDNDVIERLKTQRFPFRKTQLAFRLLLISAKLYLTYLNEIKKKIYDIEFLQLGNSLKNKEILELMQLQQSLVYFNTSLKSNEILIERTAKDGILIKTPSDKILIEHVVDENKQAIEMTNIYSNILSNTIEACASLISNNLNMVMKVLTSLTIIVALPTLVASIYGMNMALPLQDSPYAFPSVILFSFALCIVVIIFLWKKKFF
jgi:magnesium transporter